MRLRDAMTTHPLVATPDDAPADLDRLMESARVRHLPLVDDGRLAGLWMRTAEGPLVLLGPESVHEAPADADMDVVLEALFSGREAVVALEGGEPVGVMTRADVLDIARTAVGRGIGRRATRPLVLRFVGPAGAGKTTLMIRTVDLLRRVEAGVVQANASRPADGATVAGAPALDAPGAHWRKGLADCVAALGDRQLVMVEDRDGPPRTGPGIGEDLQVVVVAADDLAGVDPDGLRDAQAVVVTKMDVAASGGDADAACERLRAARPGLAVFCVSSDQGDRGLHEWGSWVEGQVLRQGR
jgi:Ni2+-binding GTPase involved in maturation of urease and hydrogenase